MIGKIKIQKVRNVRTPDRGTPLSVGLDFYVPFGPDLEIPPYGDILIPSGIKAKVPAGYVLIAADKSGKAVAGFIVGAKVIDEDYQGEIHIHLFNRTNKFLVLRGDGNEKAAQFILHDAYYPEVEECDYAIFAEDESERGTGGFGSTNIKAEHDEEV